MDRQAVLFARFDQPIAVLRVVVVGEKDRLAIVAALDDVQRLAFNEIATDEPW